MAGLDHLKLRNVHLLSNRSVASSPNIIHNWVDLTYYRTSKDQLFQIHKKINIFFSNPKEIKHSQ